MPDIALAYWHIILTYHPMDSFSFQIYQSGNWVLGELINLLKIK